jgi:thiamine kinase-like enzyme
MINLPLYLVEFLNNNSYSFKETLQFNERKKVYVLKIEKNNKYFVLKTYDANQSIEAVKQKFDIEKDFYKKDIDLLPDLVYCEDNIMILEYIDSVSLRDILVQNMLNKLVLNNLLNGIELFKNKIKSNNQDGISNFDNIFRYISSLCNSHPFRAKDIKTSLIDRFLNKLMTKILIYKTKNLIDYISVDKLTKGFSHMDFHYNNILVNRSNEIKFIDFENIKYIGFFEFDILFLIVLIEVYVKSNSEEDRIIKRYLNSMFEQNKDLEKIYDIYKTAISINKKFYVNSYNKPLSIFQKIVLIAKEVFNATKY